MQVNGKYLKDETGTTFSPITSTNTVFYNQTSISPLISKLQNLNNYCIASQTAYDWETTVTQGGVDLNYPFNDLVTNNNELFSLSNNKVKLTFSDSKIHHIQTKFTLFMSLRTQTDARIDISSYVQRNGLVFEDDTLNTSNAMGFVSVNEQYVSSEMYVYNDYFCVQNGDLLSLYLNAWLYNASNEIIRFSGTVLKNNKRQFHSKLQINLVD